MPDLTGVALSLAAEGFYVFPCQPNGKPPALTGWQEASTRDPDMIRRLWSAYGTDCNVGIDCGKSGIIVIDLDAKSGGPATWEILQLVHGDAPPTRVHSTPGGGQHWIFRQPNVTANQFQDNFCENSANFASKMPSDTFFELRNQIGWQQGIDIRGVGGLIVGPGSIIDGKPYAVSNPWGILDLPSPWHAAIGAARREVRKNDGDADLDEPINVEHYKLLLDRVYVEEGPWGQEDAPDTFAIAAKGKDRGLSEELVVDMLTEYCGEHERGWLAVTVHNAFEYGQNDPACDAIVPGSKLYADNPILLEAAEEQKTDRLWRPRDMARMPRITYYDRDGLLPKLRSGVGIWFGPSGEHKTNVVITKIFELLEDNPEISVLYLCGEGQEGFGPRLTAGFHARGLDPETSGLNDRLAAHYVPMMGDLSEIQRCLDRLRHEAFKPRVVFVDTMANALVGFDEDNRTAGQLTRNGAIGKFAAEVGALVILIGHTGKDKTAGLRGAQGFYDSVDVVIAHNADREDNARTVVLSTFKKDGGKQKDGGKTRAYYALDSFNGMVVPRRCEHREYARLQEGDKYDFSAEEVVHALAGVVGYEHGISSKIVVMRLWPNDHGEDPEKYDTYINRHAARLERQAARHTSFNNAGARIAGANVPLLWFLPT